MDGEKEEKKRRTEIEKVCDIMRETKEELEKNKNEKLYTIAATSYVGRFIGMIGDLSGGLYNYRLKNSMGQEITNIRDAVVTADGLNTKRSEVKAWQAVIRFFLKKAKQHTKSVPLFHISAQNEAPFIIAKNNLSFYNLTHGSIWIQKVFLSICVFLIFIILSLGMGLISKRVGRNAIHRSATKS